VIGCGLPMLRYGWRDALKVGVGMTPRGEVALIVALIGLQMDPPAISQRAYAMVIFMTAVTTMIPPPFLRWLYREESEAAATAYAAGMPSSEAETARAETVPGSLG
jgi:Kef-type K+ transport system membrane component KefB